MKYINLYNNHEEYLEYNDISGITAPNVSVCKEEEECHYIKERFLVFAAEQDNASIYIYKSTSYSYLSANIEYSLDGMTWEEYPFIGLGGLNIELKHKGDFVEFRNNTGNFSSSSTYYYCFRIDGLVSCGGDVMALINYYEEDVQLSDNCFARLFSGCTGLTSAPELPATALTYYCYYNMFAGCTSLTTAPELPATTLANGCYANMFYGCTSLTTAPELPATTLANSCYYRMFQGCTSLTTGPSILPATTLAQYCYQYMFAYCNSLTTAPSILPATTLADYCYSHMFEGCTSLTSAPELPATTLSNYCYEYMFDGCTSLTTAPELPAITLVQSCYQRMFEGCVNLSYIKALFTNNSQYNTGYWVYNVASSGTFVKNIENTGITHSSSGIPAYWNIEYYPEEPDYIDDSDILTFVCDEAGSTISIKRPYDSNVSLKYSLNNGITWDDYIFSGSSGETIILQNVGNTIKFIGNENGSLCTNYSMINPESARATMFSMTGKFSSYGNVKSLLSKYDLGYMPEGGFMKLFSGCTGLTIAPKLPQITYYSCFYKMFAGCTSLETPPKLPATEVAYSAYTLMFAGCTSLETAPELPATTLNGCCYYGMFSGCTSLTSAPELPATVVNKYGYFGMFYGCTKLTTAPELPATALGQYCYSNMFRECESLTTAPELPATEFNRACYSYMFAGCTSLKTAPELTATTMTYSAYTGMFSGCSSLINVQSALPATILAPYCYSFMFSDCTSLITAPELPVNGVMQPYCYYGMFKGCTKLTAAPELPSTEVRDGCYSGMFSGCTSLTTAPELPAIVLSGTCYANMFNGCSKLNYIKALFAENTSANTNNWVNGVASGGTFVKNVFCIAKKSVSGIPPYNWSVNVVGNDDWVLKLRPAITSHIYIKFSGRSSTYPKIYYKVSNGDWEKMTSSTTIDVPQTGYCKIFGLNTSELGKFILSGQTICEGNVNSLIIPDENNYSTVSSYIFRNLFSGCTSLMTAPELPATALTSHCYYNMFYGCTSLATGPSILPATAVAAYCYYSMFKGCTSLTTAPELPATTLNSYCYDYMFSGCSNLNYIKALFITTPSVSYTYNWVSGVASAGTFVKNSSAEWDVTDTNGIPSGWTVQTASQ